MEEDFPLGERMQIGFESGATEEVIYGRNEPSLVHFHTLHPQRPRRGGGRRRAVPASGGGGWRWGGARAGCRAVRALSWRARRRRRVRAPAQGRRATSDGEGF